MARGVGIDHIADGRHNALEEGLVHQRGVGGRKNLRVACKAKELRFVPMVLENPRVQVGDELWFHHMVRMGGCWL